MESDHCRELSSFLEKGVSEISVVVTPDFFLDRLISIRWNVETLSRKLEDVAKRKGGSIDNIVQAESKGGNAINTASALAALGAKITPIVCTNRIGLQMLRFYFQHKSVDFSHVKVFDEASLTSALELETKDGKVNVMLRNVGALADFGPQHLDDSDFEVMGNSDYVCVFNWAGTKHFGTELATTVFHRTKMGGKGKTYYDTADPTPNRGKIPELMNKVLLGKDVDILSLNENEAICYGMQLESKREVHEKYSKLEEEADRFARAMAPRLSSRIDLHTTSYSATFRKRAKTTVPAFKVPVLRATGAGDAWNAGNILGDASGLPDEYRLTLANAIAAYYISNQDGTHPTSRQLTRFLRELERRKR